MSFTRITETELAQRGATILPNQPTNYSATQLKQEFDAPAKNIIAPKFNTLVGELEATTASGSLGAVAPTGRTGTTIQGVLDSISADLENVEAEAHTHTNKAILDDYTQTETDLADAVAKKHEHTNKALLDTYTQADGDIADAVTKKHEHSNKSVLDDLSDSGGALKYKGNPIDGTVKDAYKSVKVTSGGTSTAIDASGEDSFELYAGANVTMSVDTSVTPKKITVNSTGGGGGGGSYTPGNGIDISGSTISVDFGTVDSATTTKPPTGQAVKSAIDAVKVGDLSDTTLTSVSDGDLLTAETVGGVTTWKNKAPDKSLARYGGSISDASNLPALNASNVDKFYLVTVDITTTADFVVGAGKTIPADSHIAVIEYPENSGTYKYDDFGGFVDISGKADKTELDSWVGTYQTVSSAGEVTFSNVDDTSDNGYILMCERPNVSSKIKTLTNPNTDHMEVVFTVTGAQTGDKCKLRILK